jgi:hypothetical protein
MRRFLYSRWFFLFLAIVCIVDVIADLGEWFWGRDVLNALAIAMDVIAAGLACWIFLDLQSRRPKHGDRPHS